MHIPRTTTKVDARHILLLLLSFSALSFYILWPSSSKDPCTQDTLSFWNGEYPEPVVVVRKETLQKGYETLCTEKKTPCTIAAGIIHPWSKEKYSYASKPSVVSYRARQNFSSDLHDYEAGIEIEYEGETPDGMCSFRRGSDRWQSSCQFMDTLEHIAGDPQAKGRQFFLASCLQGGQSWIEVDEELFSDVSVDRGFIKGYGVISAD
jgi:hypothetical protein